MENKNSSFSSNYSEIQPLLSTDSLIGIGNNNNSNISSSLSINTTNKIQKSSNIQFNREERNSYLFEPSFDENIDNIDKEEVLASNFYNNHPTYKVLGSKRLCQIPSMFSSLSVIISIIIIFINIVVLLIYPFDQNIYFGGGTMQQWIVIFDISCLILLILWIIAKILNLILLVLVEFFLHPFIEILLINWRMYEITILGLLWGIISGLSWVLFVDYNTKYEISSNMEKIMHDLTIAVILLYSVIGFKVFIISSYEARLYKKFKHLIGLSTREERDLTRIERKIVKNPKEHYLSQKFQEYNLDSYMSKSPFSQKISHNSNYLDNLTSHVSIHFASATFANAFIDFFCSNNDGILYKSDFKRVGGNLQSKYLEKIFDYLDTDNDGKISSIDLNLALRDVFRIRKTLKKCMKTRRVLLEVTNSICNIILVISSGIIVFVYVFEINIVDYAIPFATLILAFSFAYQTILQDTVDNLYTLFFVRPFNIGDLININGESYYLEEVGLLSSTCLHEDGYMCYISNSLIRKNIFINYNRGNFVKLTFNCYIKSSTTLQDLEEYKRKITLFCANSQIFSSKVSCYTEPNMNPSPILITKLKLKNNVKWQDKKKRHFAQTKGTIAITSITEELGILDLRNKLNIEKQSII